MPDAVDHSPLETCPVCGGSMIPGDIYCFGCWCNTSREERAALMQAAESTTQKAKTCAEQSADWFGFTDKVTRRRGRR